MEDIQWVGQKIVFIVTEKGKLYRSADGGKSWENQMHTLTNGQGVASVESVHFSPVDRMRMYIQGSGVNNWFTTDGGATYTPSNTLDVAEVRFHPTQSTWLLGSSMAPACKARKEGQYCFKSMHYSKDSGATWTKAADYIVQFDWSPAVKDSNGYLVSETLIYATLNSEQHGNQRFGLWDKNIHFVSSKDFFATYTVVVMHGNRFLFGDHAYLFVAAVNPKKETEVQLQISRDNITRVQFQRALLPVKLTERSYTILDTSEGSVFVHVNHQPYSDSAYAGHVYVSDWSGIKYSLSLPYNHRNAEGKCDFEKVEGLEGIYLGNFVDQEEMDRVARDAAAGGEQGVNTADSGKQRSKAHLRTKTVITFDKGGEWSYIPPPRKDSQGKDINCGEACRLHLHGVTDLNGPVYSSKNAVGLLMATGNVGEYIQQNRDAINTYLSRDAGLTWKEVAKGSHIYEFGDHGGLMVMAADDRETDSIRYSWDQGLSWETLLISDSKMRIENVIIEPKSIALQFVVYGWQGDTGVLVHLDFAALHTRVCQGYDSPDTAASDYEYFSPSDGRLNKCLMGHTIKYTRRKPEIRCFNPEQLERSVFIEHCKCAREDFECDYGYEHQNADGSGPCVKAKLAPEYEDPIAPPCAEYSRVTRGYRRVPGDTCVGGDEWDAVETLCPSTASRLFRYVFLVLLVCVAVLAALHWSGRLDVRALVRGVAARNGYLKVGESEHALTDDPDAFYLNEDDFGPSAHLIDGTGAAGAKQRYRDAEEEEDLEAEQRVKESAASAFKPLPLVRQAPRDKNVSRRPRMHASSRHATPRHARSVHTRAYTRVCLCMQYSLHFVPASPPSSIILNPLTHPVLTGADSGSAESRLRGSAATGLERGLADVGRRLPMLYRCCVRPKAHQRRCETGQLMSLISGGARLAG